jgi:hypothetical protein
MKIKLYKLMWAERIYMSLTCFLFWAHEPPAVPSFKGGGRGGREGSTVPPHL